MSKTVGMEVIKDKRDWLINITIKKKECPFLYYPANFECCRLLPESNQLCTKENCKYVKENK
jgi:hypothetical protein